MALNSSLKVIYQLRTSGTETGQVVKLGAPPKLFLVRLSLRVVIMLGDLVKFSAWLCFKTRSSFLRGIVISRCRR